jgi:hypothetical protein
MNERQQSQEVLPLIVFSIPLKTLANGDYGTSEFTAANAVRLVQKNNGYR